MLTEDMANFQKDWNAALFAVRKDRPRIIDNYYSGKVRNNSFRGELFVLRKKLLAERYTGKKEFFRLLYIGMCDYFMGKYRYAYQFIQMAQDMKICDEFLPLIMMIKDRSTRLQRVLLIVAYDNVDGYNFRRLEKVDRNINVEVLSSYVNIEKMLQSWNHFDQVYLLGHGADETTDGKNYILIGNKEFTPEHLLNYLKDGANNVPSALGIFSCGNGFNHSAIRSKLDFFMTDNQSSVPEFVEMFFNGFLTEYFNSFRISSAFTMGKLATVFRAGSDPTVELYARDFRVQ